MEELSIFERGWVSALIDGEGSIRLRERNDGNTFKPSIAVSNNSKELLEKLKEIVPEGKVYEDNREEENWERSFQFVIWKHETIENLLKQIIDHLVIKERRAKLMIEFLEKRQSHEKSRDARGRFVSEGTDPVEKEIYEKFRSL